MRLDGLPISIHVNKQTGGGVNGQTNAWPLVRSAWVVIVYLWLLLSMNHMFFQMRMPFCYNCQSANVLMV